MFGGNHRREVKRLHELLSGYVDSSELSENRETFRFGENGHFFPSLAEALKWAGYGRTEYKRALRRLVGGSVVIFLVALIFGNPVVVLLVAVLLSFEYGKIKRRGFQRAEEFERDYTALLLSLASGVRTGLDPMVALCQCGALFPEEAPLRLEIKKVEHKISQGLSEEVVIREFADTINHPDIKLFRTGFILARREGSSLAGCLQRLVRVTRQRQSFRRKVRSSLAMQKLSVWGILVCTLAIGLIQFATNMDSLRAALDNPLGVKALGFGLGLIGIGLVWMMHLSKSRI